MWNPAIHHKQGGMSISSAVLDYHIYPYRIRRTARVLSRLCQIDTPHMPVEYDDFSLPVYDRGAADTHVALYEDLVRPSATSANESHTSLTEICPLWWWRSRYSCSITLDKYREDTK